MNQSLVEIRKRAMSLRIPLDEDLRRIGAVHPSHRFLENPAGQNVYLYLLAYVKSVCEWHFALPFQETRILDWGAGKGHVSFLLRKLGANPTSCDIVNQSDDSSFGQSTPIVDEWRLPIEPLHSPVELPYEDNSMDVVLSVGVLEHVQDDMASLNEVNRILTPNGLFFCFNLPYSFSWTQRLAHARGNFYHDRLYTKKQVTSMLAESGFRLLDIWHRQLLPKNSVTYPKYHAIEDFDQFLTNYTPLRHFATNIEFLAHKPS